MNLPKPFIIVCLVFLSFGFLMWFTAAIPVFLQSAGMAQNGPNVFLPPLIMGGLALILLFALKQAGSDDYGSLKYLENVTTIKPADPMEEEISSDLALNIVMGVVLLITVGPLILYLGGLMFTQSP